MTNKSQGIVRDNKGEEQPADKERAQNVTSVEEKKKTEDEVQKTAEKSGFWGPDGVLGHQRERGISEREIMGKLVLGLLAISIAVLLGFSVWVIFLWSPLSLKFDLAQYCRRFRISQPSAAVANGGKNGKLVLWRRKLKYKGIVTSSAYDAVMTPEFLKEQAERCRRLARGADPFTEKRLLDLAGEYDARLTEIERGFRPSPASRMLKVEA
jgi:hypothetical protein